MNHINFLNPSELITTATKNKIKNVILASQKLSLILFYNRNENFCKVNKFYQFDTLNFDCIKRKQF